ncbi:hypothetical protein LY78DRAFT_660166 [Colletotrichum sublineola]|nr:hypothetical protein LY78DRAFT_660166 [Colletotrichum sublineola]
MYVHGHHLIQAIINHQVSHHWYQSIRIQSSPRIDMASVTYECALRFGTSTGMHSKYERKTETTWWGKCTAFPSDRSAATHEALPFFLVTYPIASLIVIRVCETDKTKEKKKAVRHVLQLSSSRTQYQVLSRYDPLRND